LQSSQQLHADVLTFFEQGHSPLQQAQHPSATLTAAALQQAQHALAAVSFLAHAHSPLQQAQQSLTLTVAALQQAPQALAAAAQQPLLELQQARVSFFAQQPVSPLQQPQHALATEATALQQAPQLLAAAAQAPQLFVFLQQPVLHELASALHGVLQSSESQQLPHSSFLPHSGLHGVHGFVAAGQASVQAGEVSSQG
jgi:hypothetical protein